MEGKNLGKPAGPRLLEGALGLVVLAVLLNAMAKTKADPDLWGYLAFGRLFWETGAFPYQDVFSYVPTLPLWVYHEWLTGVLFYPLYQALGGRYEKVYPPGVAAHYFDFINQKGNSRQFLEDYPPDLILLAPRSKAYGLIASHPGWRRVYADAASALFGRRPGLPSTPGASAPPALAGDSPPTRQARFGALPGPTRNVNYTSRPGDKL